MNLHDFIRSRRSYRSFDPGSIPRKVLERIITTATWAPSAHNRQPWRFVVLTSPETKARLASAMGEQFYQELLKDGFSLVEVEKRVKRSRSRIESAPAAILLCLDPQQVDIVPGEGRQDLEIQMAVQSVALAGGTLLLAAHAEGLGGVWLCAPLFARKVVQDTLSLPADWQPQALLLFGYPPHEEQELPERTRRPLDEVALFLD